MNYLNKYLPPKVRGAIGIVSTVLAGLGVAVDGETGQASATVSGVEIIGQVPPDVIAKYQSASKELDAAQAKVNEFYQQINGLVGQVTDTAEKGSGIVGEVTDFAGDNTLWFLIGGVILALFGRNPLSRVPDGKESDNPEKQE